MTNLKGKFSFFSCCIIVEGHSRAIIYDSQRLNYIFIPNSLALILKQENDIDVILEKYAENKEAILEYFEFLEEYEFLFWTDNPEQFPQISTNHSIPRIVENSIIELGEHDLVKLTILIEQLQEIDCPNVSLNIDYPASPNQLEEYLDLFNNSTIRNVEIYVENNPNTTFSDYETILKKTGRLTRLIAWNSPYDKFDTITKSLKQEVELGFIKQGYNGHISCGNISPEYFTLHFKSFLTLKNHNGCLYGKIAVDQNGDIKNCPSMVESFGNIEDTTLAEALEVPNFKNLWDLTKDKIDVCKDCEFRYVCTDCRAYIEDPKDILSKPLKCGYNPYTAEWSDWSTNPLKQKAIDFYEMRDMVSSN
ncbi:MAG: SPASM domain peptide maturase of grasp-with-spasm system [Crocinitomix sp.]|jgi:SPASM domain peptide maturase of grasp-with-spasm system